MNENIQNVIGQRLRMLRIVRKETQKELGELLGITAAAYGKLESGDRGLSSEYCIDLANHYGVSCDYILRGIEAANIDVCSRTPLTQQTVAYLETLHNKRAGYEAAYLECCKNIQKRIDEKAESTDLQLKDTNEHARALAYLIDMENNRNALLNELLTSEHFMDSLTDAARAISHAVSMRLEMDQKTDCCFPAEYVRTQCSDEINAALFSVQRTLIRILEDLSEDADFIQVITVLSPETIDKAVERRMLHHSKHRR